MIAWAGYDHLQQATAIAAYYVRIKEELGGSDDKRLIPLLAALIELLPWLAQWHNEPSTVFNGLKMGDYYDGFVKEEARSLPKKSTNEEGEETITTGWTLKEISAWQPPARSRRTKKKATKKKATKKATKKKTAKKKSKTIDN